MRHIGRRIPRSRRRQCIATPSLIVEVLEPRLLLTISSPVHTANDALPQTELEPSSVAPSSLLVYYAYPSGINGTFTVNGAAAVFGQYRFVVLGDCLEQDTHPDHANTVAIMNHSSTSDTLFFGYVTVGVSSQNLSQAEIEAKIDAWKAAGADGIFFDEFGYDYGVSRERQNAAVDYAHSVGLTVIANGWQIAHVFGTAIDPTWNPTGAETHLTASDYYLYESYQVQEGVTVDAATWRAKADALQSVRATLPIQILSVTTTNSTEFSQSQFDYAFWSAALDGHVGFGWGEASFSSLTASAPFRGRPVAELGTGFVSLVQGNTDLFTRNTTAGWITVDPQTQQGGFNLLDFGDAPDTGAGTGSGNYQTTIDDNGARHVVGGVRLGTSVDFEPLPLTTMTGPNSTQGYGDNVYGADEDGVRFDSLWQSSATQSYSATVLVTVSQASGPAWLNTWVDFNSDGDFDDAGEHVLTNVSASNGTQQLTITIPAGALSGKTYARFRISSTPGLSATGLANDGEVEDYAVLIGGPAALGTVEQMIAAHLFPNGLLRSSNDPSFGDQGNNPWYILDPYFSSLAVRALLAAGDTATVDPLGIAADQLEFWLQNIQHLAAYPEGADAIIPRLFADQNGTVLGLNDTVTASDGTVFSSSTFGADADDSALAMILSLAAEIHDAGGSSILEAPGRRAELELVADSLVAMIEPNGLTWNFRDTNKDRVQYTLDNLEVWQALNQFAAIERDVYHDAARADTYAAAAATVRAGIQQELIDPVTGLFRWYAGGPTPVVNNWDILILDQIWPMLTTFLPPDSVAAQQLYAAVDQTWNGTDRPHWADHRDSAFLAWAAVQQGDLADANRSVATLLPWALQNTPPGVTLSVKDLGFLLQALLPAAGDDSATTGHNQSVTIDVRQNDYSLTTPQNQLVLSLVEGPASGTVQIVDGKFVYTPGTAFGGDDSFVYKVQASDGGTRSARVAVHVNALPVLTGSSSVSYVEDSLAVALQPGLTVTDLESAIHSATITITGFLSAEDDLSFVPNAGTMGNISIVSNSSGVLQLGSAGGTATVEQWQTALRAVSYRNSSHNPGTQPRTVTIVVQDNLDASAPFECTLQVTAVNDLPTLGGFDAARTYAAGGAAVLLDANVTLADVDSTRFGGATLTVAITANAESTDRLQLRAVNRVLDVTGDSVTYRGTQIGTISGGVGNTPLVITLDPTATLSAVQTVLRNLQFLSLSSNPGTGARTVTVTLQEAGSATGRTVAQQISITSSSATASTTQDVVASLPSAIPETMPFQNAVDAPGSTSAAGVPRIPVGADDISADVARSWDDVFQHPDGLFENAGTGFLSDPSKTRRRFRLW